MSYGINISNASSQLIIDGTRPNFEVAEYGVVMPQDDPDAIGMWGWLLPRTVEGLCLVRPENNVRIGMMNYYSDNWPGVTYDRNFVSRYEGGYGIATPLEYARVKPVTTAFSAGGQNYGLQIYGASSQPIFNSNQKLFFVDAIFTIYQYAPGPFSVNTFNFTLPTPEYGKRYFQLITRQSTGEYGADPAIVLTRNGETNVEITLFGPVENVWGGGIIQANTFKLCTGYFQ